LAIYLAAYKTNAVVTVTECIPKYFVRSTGDWTFKTVGTSTVFANQESAISANFEATIRQRIFQMGSYHHVLEISRASEDSHGRIFENLAHSFVGVKNGNMLLQDVG
jgi:DNA integrity scanning protein DisA with diadenylate cyclase activity